MPFPDSLKKSNAIIEATESGIKITSASRDNFNKLVAELPRNEFLTINEQEMICFLSNELASFLAGHPDMMGFDVKALKKLATVPGEKKGDAYGLPSVKPGQSELHEEPVNRPKLGRS